MVIDFNELPPRDQMQDIVADLGLDDVLVNLNTAREIIMQNGDDATEDQSHMGILLARRLRELRKNSRSKKKAKAKEPDAPLDDLLKGL